MLRDMYEFDRSSTKVFSQMGRRHSGQAGQKVAAVIHIHNATPTVCGRVAVLCCYSSARLVGSTTFRETNINNHSEKQTSQTAKQLQEYSRMSVDRVVTDNSKKGMYTSVALSLLLCLLLSSYDSFEEDHRREHKRRCSSETQVTSWPSLEKIAERE